MAKLHRLMPETLFAGSFVIQRVLGEGAMGTVYLANMQSDGAPVALKVLKPSIAEDGRATARFAREAIVGSRIENPHVVDVHDAGFDEDTGLHWLAMEYLQGDALPAFLAREQPEAASRHTLLRQLFDAMAAAHRAGVLHRDLKPENIVILGTAAEPLLKVLDFGVAKTFAPAMAASATEGGLGTPLWAAPEQGRGGVHMRPAVDVWALGLLTFFICTGKFYWWHANRQSSSMLDLAEEMLQKPIMVPSERARKMDVSGWPEALDNWFMRCVQRDANQRLANADHARAALFPLLGFEAPAVQPSVTPGSTSKDPSPVTTSTSDATPLIAVVTIVLAALIGAAAILLL